MKDPKAQFKMDQGKREQEDHTKKHLKKAVKPHAVGDDALNFDRTNQKQIEAASEHKLVNLHQSSNKIHAQPEQKVIKLPGYIEVERELGRGGFGLVLQVVNTRTGGRFALKIDTGDQETVRREQQVYRNIHRCALGVRAPGFIRSLLIRLASTEGMLMDLKGPSLQSLIEKSPQKVTLGVIFNVAQQALQRIRNVHQAGYVHGDIKPENILQGLEDDPKDRDTYYLIDLGLATEYLTGRKHIEAQRTSRIAGSLYFMSLNASSGIVQTRRDDIESLAYTLIYLARKDLPWMQFKSTHGVTIKDLNRSVHCMKRDVNIDQLCKNLPTTLKDFLIYSRNLAFDTKPNYVRWMRLFKKQQQSYRKTQVKNVIKKISEKTQKL